MIFKPDKKFFYFLFTSHQKKQVTHSFLFFLKSFFFFFFFLQEPVRRCPQPYLTVFLRISYWSHSLWLMWNLSEMAWLGWILKRWTSPWVLLVCQLGPEHKGQGRTEEKDLSRLVGGRFSKLGNHIRACLGCRKSSKSLHLLARMLNRLCRGLNESHNHSRWSSQHLTLSRLRPWK